MLLALGRTARWRLLVLSALVQVLMLLLLVHSNWLIQPERNRLVLAHRLVLHWELIGLLGPRLQRRHCHHSAIVIEIMILQLSKSVGIALVDPFQVDWVDGGYWGCCPHWVSLVQEFIDPARWTVSQSSSLNAFMLRYRWEVKVAIFRRDSLRVFIWGDDFKFLVLLRHEIIHVKRVQGPFASCSPT